MRGCEVLSYSITTQFVALCTPPHAARLNAELCLPHAYAGACFVSAHDIGESWRGWNEGVLSNRTIYLLVSDTVLWMTEDPRANNINPT